LRTDVTILLAILRHSSEEFQSFRDDEVQGKREKYNKNVPLDARISFLLSISSIDNLLNTVFAANQVPGSRSWKMARTISSIEIFLVLLEINSEPYERQEINLCI